MRETDYSWGDPDAEGIALGLKVTSANSSCAYRIAVANRSPEPRAVVLFATLDDKIRTRIVARTPAGEQARPAVVPAIPVSSNIRIAIELEPGQVIEREGTAASFGITGDAKIQLVLGGVKARPDELTSGEVSVTFAD